MERNVHDIEERLESVMRRIRGESVKNRFGTVNYIDSINPKNRDFILRFLAVAKARVNSLTRLVFYANNLWIVARLLKIHMNDKTIEELSKEDVDTLVGIIKTVKNRNGEQYSENSKHDLLITLKKAMQFARGFSWVSKKYPPEVEDVKPIVKREDRKMPDQLITRHDLELLVSATKKNRDMAMFHTLYETGARISELLKMRICDVEFDDYGAIVLLPAGKTGRRKIRLVTSATHLAHWINNHPDKSNPDAYIWCQMKNENDRKVLARMTYNAVRILLSRLRIRAGIRKEMHPHLFRHSRMTELANVLTEPQLCNYAGWVIGSDMPRTYVHLSMRDMDDALLAANGIKRPEALPTTVKECARCSAKNQSVAKLCHRCMLPLDDRTAVEIEKNKASMLSQIQEEVVMEILAKPENMELLKRKLQERVRISSQ